LVEQLISMCVYKKIIIIGIVILAGNTAHVIISLIYIIFYLRVINAACGYR